MEIKRDKYLSQLEEMMHTRFVKIVTGMRRCGKSYLLFNLFNDYLLQSGVDEEHIIKISLERYSNSHLRDPKELYQYIDSKIVDKKMYYVMLDEVQLVPNFADILNDFLSRKNVDLYATGSNAKLLSKDIITEFRGRGHEIKMYPLVFKEYMSAFDGSVQKGFDEYLTYGGLPQIFDYKSNEAKSQFLKNLFDEAYLKDIKERYEIRREDDLNELIDLISSNVSCLVNPKKLSDTFKSVKGIDISNETICRYLGYLEDAFIISKATRYDIKGKNYIDTPYKYYFEDVGLRNARLNFRQTERTHLLENIVYNELKYRGYNIDVGVVPVRIVNKEGKLQRVQLEIDFVCNLGSKRYYVQSAYSLSTDEKVDQESASLIRINDSFKKIIVTADEVVPRRNNAGITTINIYDFLLNENSLEL